jgi:uncharacterized membrane protein
VTEPPVGRAAVPAPTFPRDSTEFNRIINITDGVASIAVTLLVLSLDLPNPATTPDQHLSTILAQLRGPFFAFALSFAIVAFAWWGHHRFIAQLRGLDGVMVVWNIVFLFALVMVPFAADLVGLYSTSNEAVALYAAIMGSLYIIDLPGHELAHRRGLMEEPISGAPWRWRLIESAVPGVCFYLSVPLAWAYGFNSACWLWPLAWPVAALVKRHRLGPAARPRHRS